MTPDDKRLERERYDARSRSELESPLADTVLGAAGLPEVVRAPYLWYEAAVREVVRDGAEVLEIGSGSGMHTGALLATGARVTAMDIAPASLALLSQRLDTPHRGRLRTVVGDMESLPFAAACFDVVACAGSLSYGAPSVVDAELLRVLRPGGDVVFVDTFNHHPIYRLNRLLHFWRGERSLATLRQMPDVARLRGWGALFRTVEVRYFGSITWAMPVVSRIVGPRLAARLSDTCDQFVGVRRSAFKFVAVGRWRL